MNKTSTAAQAFAKNRAEELGFDLWNEFVVPLYFDKLSLDEVRKPIVFEGGRGCGKTTLLRYLSHGTQLSTRRDLTQENIPKQIGLYLRADTHHLRTFRGDALADAEWEKAFEHDLCLSIALEFLNALMLLNSGTKRTATFPGVDKLQFQSWQDFDPSAPIDVYGLASHLRSTRNRFVMWLNNPEENAKPKFIPLRHALLELINTAKKQLPFLADQVFFVFIDEYENLLDYQMKVINTRLKHSESPLIFHIATKRNGMTTRATLGSENLQDRDDFRRFDIEDLSEADFPLFAAELFCFRLRKKDIRIGPAVIDAELLCSPEKIYFRRNDTQYRADTIAAAKFVLPEVRGELASKFIMTDGTLRDRLSKLINDALKSSDPSLNAAQFIRDDAPSESICVPALIHQGKKPKNILEELDKAAAGKQSQFKSAEWIHNYLQGSIFLLYLPLQRPAILYAGFDAFLQLAKGNSRHFLELCHLSMLKSSLSSEQSISAVKPEDQAVAAREASAMFVKETQGSGDQGNRLFHVVNTLGQIFRLSHARPSQGEPERTHFAITGGEVDAESQRLLAECIKWSVLFVTTETKVKETRLEAYDYIFNPIYAPYFGISFRKGRKLEISSETLRSLLTGTREIMNTLVKDYQKAWQLTNQDQLHLFAGEK